jgi:hypothetical protein
MAAGTRTPTVPNRPPERRRLSLDRAVTGTPDRRVLLFYERDLRALPVDLDEYARLEVLDLNRNPRLGSLPSLARLGALRFLYAETLDGLVALRDLDLRANHLRAVPRALGELPSLERLDLRWNPLPDLPRELRRLAEQDGVLWHPAT